MKKSWSPKFTVFMIFVGLFSIVFAVNFLKLAVELNQLYTLPEFREEINLAIEEDPEFLEKYFDMDKDTELTDEKLEEMIPIAKKKGYLASLGICFVIALLFSVILFVPILFFVLPVITSNNAFKKYKLNEDDFKGSKDYFRDVLKDYNPSELSYIDDFKIDKNTLIADLLMLENKKVIVYEEGVFKRGENFDKVKLNDIEKYLVSLVSEKGTNLIKVNYLQYVDIIKNNCVKDKILEAKKFPKKKFIIEIVISVILYFILYKLVFNVELFNSLNLGTGLLSTIAFIIFVFLAIFVVFYPMYLIQKYVILFIRLNVSNFGRSNLGEEINKKLEGLKIFIRDFSILEGKQKKELILWNEYLVYSVMFNINKKIINEYNESVKF